MGNFLSNYRIPISFFVLAVFFFLARPTPGSLLAGLPLVLLGVGLRIWASGDIRKNDELATKGPYALTRNPLYLGNFLMGLGFSLMAARLWLVLIFFVVFYGIYHATIRKEEEVLQVRFVDDFDRYKQSVPRFFPRWPSSRDRLREKVFDWRLVKQHREYRNWLGVTAIFLLMVLKLILR